MNLLTRLLTLFKSLFSKGSQTVEGTETTISQPDVNTATGNETQTVIVPDTAGTAQTVAESTVQQPQSANTSTVQDPVVVTSQDVFSAGFMGDVKTLLQTAGHDVDLVWEDAVDFARKAAQGLPALPEVLADKLVMVLRVAGHDVSDIISDAFSFARKHGKS